MIVCREIDSSKQGQAWLMRVTPAPEIHDGRELRHIWTEQKEQDGYT